MAHLVWQFFNLVAHILVTQNALPDPDTSIQYTDCGHAAVYFEDRSWFVQIYCWHNDRSYSGRYWQYDPDTNTIDFVHGFSPAYHAETEDMPGWDCEGQGDRVCGQP